MFRSMPIFRRLFIAFALATIIPGIIVVLLGGFFVTALSARSQAVQTSFDATTQASRQQVDLNRIDALLQANFAQVVLASLNSNAVDAGSTLAATQRTILEVSALQIDFDHQLTTFQQSYDLTNSSNMSSIHAILIGDDPNTTLITDQNNALSAVTGPSGQWNIYSRDVATLLNAINPTDPATGTAVPFKIANYATVYQDLYTSSLDYVNLRNSWQKVVDNAAKVGATVTNLGPSLINPLLFYTGGALLATILIIIWAAYIVNSTITQPLHQLVVLTKRIANGETDARAQIKGRDEIYAVASSMNNMLEYTVRLVHDAQERHSALQMQIEKLVNEVSGVGEGDLTIQAEVTTDELGVLADSFNYMTEELSNLVVRVKTLSRDVESATITSFDRIAQLVQGADLQIQQIVTAAIEVGEMATSSRNVAERSQILTEIALTARQTAQGGRGAMQQTVAGIRRIERNVKSTAEKVQVLGERSREINDIVKVISSIAHQTNRLALDAAIQAAMAGENGKGFGAVASDIRRLAERSKEQTLMIGQIVYSVLDDISSAASAMSDTERETSSGTHLIEEASVALESIFSVVEQQASEISTINQVAMKQLQSSNAVVHIMQNVSDSTQQSNSGTREVSIQMEQVAQLAEQLLASVDVFKVREGRAPQLAAAARSGIHVLPVSNQDQYGRLAYNAPMQLPSHISQKLQRKPSPINGQFDFYQPNTPYPISTFQQPSTSTPLPNQEEYQQQYNNGNGQQYNNGNGQQYNNGNGRNRQ